MSEMHTNAVYLQLDGGKRYRVVYIAHKYGPDIPLIIFIHGFGAQLAQYDHQIMHFSQVANVLAVDLLGHGMSGSSWRSSDFRLDSIANDLVDIFHRYKLSANILVGHSMGASIAVLMYPKISESVSAVVLIGPRYSVKRSLWKLGYIPSIMWDFFRYFDQRMELASVSLKQFLHSSASDETRLRQFAINIRSSSKTLTRVLRNIQSFPSDNQWQQLAGCPALFIVGSEDKVNPPQEAETVQKLLAFAPASRPSEPTVIPQTGHNCHLENPGLVNAVISQFLVDECKIRNLDASVQLLEMANPGHKWSLKNYEKWKRTQAVSKLVGRSKLRGMKVMREADDEHSPRDLRRLYPMVGIVIDISKDSPPYVTDLLPKYVKLPSQSKICPSREDVSKFILTVDEYIKTAKPNASEIAVHCHYGFNRTGFLICSYLVERLGYGVGESLDAWKSARSPGIKHNHFKEELFLRYERTPKSSLPTSANS